MAEVAPPTDADDAAAFAAPWPPRRAEVLAWVAVVAVALAFRLVALGDKPLHHDESLFSYYSWLIATTNDYVYQPILHGPLLLYDTAAVYRAFGDSIATSRLLPALIGALLPLAALIWRRWLGVGPCLWCGATLALSPVLMYYARYFREDVPFVALVALQLAAARLWWTHGRSNGAAALLAFATLLPFTVKETSVITLFVFALFVQLWAAGDLIRERAWRAIGGGAHPLLRALKAANLGVAGAIVLLLAARLFLPHALTRPSRLLAIVLVATALVLAFWCAYILAWRAGLVPRETLLGGACWRVASTWPGLLAGTALGALAYQVFFTHFLRYPEAPHQLFRRTFDYWLGQHQEHRLAGPFHYYLPILATYHLPEALLVVAATTIRFFSPTRRYLFVGLGSLLVGVVLFWLHTMGWLPMDADADAWLDEHLHMTSLVHVWLAAVLGVGGAAYALLLIVERRIVHAFFAFWTGWSLLIYGYAGEKVPWVAVFIVFPFLVFAGCEAAAFARRLRGIASGRRRRAAQFLLALAAAASLAWMAFIAWRACLPNAAHPVERLVFNHTTRAFDRLCGAVETFVRARLAAGEPVLVHYEGEVGWPLFFYFRHLERVEDDGHRERLAEDWPRERWPEVDIIIMEHQPDDTEPDPDGFAWFRIAFREYWQPQLLPIPRMLGDATWEPVPHAGHRWMTEYEGERLGGAAAWGLLLDYHVARRPMYDPARPHGVWGVGPTAQKIAVGIRRTLAEGDDPAAAAVRAMIDDGTLEPVPSVRASVRP